METDLDQTGFTLLETLAVLTVTGLLVYMAVPNFKILTAQYRLDGAAQRLVSDLRLARQMAITERLPVSLVLRPERETYSLVRSGPQGRFVVSEVQFNDPAVGFSGIDLVGASKGNRIAFSPLGTTGSWTTITLRDKYGKNEKITVIGTGRIKRKRP